MNITLKQNEIELALRQYLRSRGLGVAVDTMPIKFGTTRNPFGITAELELPIDTSAVSNSTVDHVTESIDPTPQQFESLAEPAENTVGSILASGTIAANAADVIETTATTLVEDAPIPEEPVAIEDTKSVPEEVVQQEPVAEAAPVVAEPVAEPVKQEAAALFTTAAEVTPAAQATTTDNLFGDTKPAEQAPVAAAPVSTTSLFG